MIRTWFLALLAAGFWLLSAYGSWRPPPLGLDAPAAQFSAARADAVLGRILGPQKPHPSGSPEAGAVRARILQEFAALGVAARTRTVVSCYSEPRGHTHPCGAVTNIIADVSSGSGKQVLLMAHSDSVAAGPGAADDGSGVAIILESIRALKARGLTRGLTGHNPIVALITDGEEKGLLGAAAYIRDPLARAKTGVVINVEARGNQGPSYLFQTSPGNAPLIDLYARAVAHPATSSLYGEIYKILPNDTDLTPMLRAGLMGVNFAFIGNVAQYHTARDRRENLSAASLQHQGESVLAMADALAHADFATLKGGDAIYLDVLGRWLPRLPVGWALPLSLAALALVMLAGFLTPRARREFPQPVTVLLMPLLLLLGAAGAGFVLHGLAAW
ncbi:MAG TPA: M28 family peptidase, partial [Rhizomicrobium sp.]